jgi:flagellar motor switch protein FliM
MGRESTPDVSQPDALSAGELRWLQTLHEGLPRTVAAALSTILRNPVDVRLAGVDQLTYGKFVHGLEDPSYYNVLNAEPLGDRVMLDVELAILYPMLDCLLGGRADAAPPRRPPSDIELPLAGRIVRVVLKELHDAWQSVVPLRFEVLQIGSHPRLLRVLPADETVVLVSLAMTIGNRQGMMRLCLPSRAIRQIADRLAGKNRSEPSSAAEAGEASAERAGRGNRSAEVVVALATTSIAASELGILRVGDIIVTETAVDSPAVVSIDGVTKFRGKPGASQGRKAVALSLPAPNAAPQKSQKTKN